MKSLETIFDYHTRIMVIVNQMRRNGEAFTDAWITEKILRCLDPRFDYVIAIKESKEVDKLTVDELIGYLQAYEQKIVKENGDKVIEHALQSKFSLKKDMYEQGGLQHVNIPLEEEINKDNELDFNDFKKEDLGIQDSKEKVVETQLEKNEDNKHLLLKEDEVVIIIMRRGISSVITAISLGTIALYVEGKLH
jgi:hypothetical protein